MLRTIVTALLVVIVSVPADAKWEMSEFVILLGWPGGVQCSDDEALMQAMAQAGFNVVMGTENQLDLAHKYGLKLLFRPSLQERILKHPANWGYYVADEPFTYQFPKVAPQVKSYHQADPNHPAWINSGGGTGEFLHSFMDTFQPRVLSFTGGYQWWDSSQRPLHFAKLEADRIAALAAGIPLMRWVEVNANPMVLTLSSTGKTRWSYTAPPPPDNAEKLRQSVYTSLCYGVKGIEWFTGAILFEWGTSRLRACGEDVTAINAELQKLGPTLVGLESVEVFHTSPLPDATRQLPEDHWVRTATRDLVLGMFKDKQDNGYIMVANRKIHDERRAVLSLPSDVTKVAKFDKDEGKWMNLPLNMRRRGDHAVVEFILARGDGELLKVQTADRGNVYISQRGRPDPRLQQWREEIEKRKQKTAELPGPNEVTLLPLGTEWKFATDADDIGASKGWFDNSFNDHGWSVVRSDQTTGWESQGFPDYTGFGWYRQAFEVPAELAGRKFVYLYFGAVDEDAYVYLNGQHVFEHSVSSTGLALDEIWLTPFAFDAKPYLKFGQTNTVTVRVYNRYGMGGVYSPVYLIRANRELDAELMKAIVRQRNE